MPVYHKAITCEPGFQLVPVISYREVVMTVCKTVPEPRKKWVYDVKNEDKNGDARPKCVLVKRQVDDTSGTKCVVETTLTKVPCVRYQKVPCFVVNDSESRSPFVPAAQKVRSAPMPAVQTVRRAAVPAVQSARSPSPTTQPIRPVAAWGMQIQPPIASVAPPEAMAPIATIGSLEAISPTASIGPVVPATLLADDLLPTSSSK